MCLIDILKMKFVLGRRIPRGIVRLLDFILSIKDCLRKVKHKLLFKMLIKCILYVWGPAVTIHNTTLWMLYRTKLACGMLQYIIMWIRLKLTLCHLFYSSCLLVYILNDWDFSKVDCISHSSMRICFCKYIKTIPWVKESYCSLKLAELQSNSFSNQN